MLSKNKLIWSGETLNKIRWKRIISSNDNGDLEINDSCSGNNNILESNFFLDKELKFISNKKNKYLFKLKENYITFQFSEYCKVELSSSNFFENYGLENNTLKLKYECSSFHKQSTLKIGLSKSCSVGFKY